LLDAEPETVDRFAEAAASVVDDEEVVVSIVAGPKGDYSYPTGHDAPPDPNGTF
jgi:hypothetical protein